MSELSRLLVIWLTGLGLCACGRIVSATAYDWIKRRSIPKSEEFERECADMICGPVNGSSGFLINRDAYNRNLREVWNRARKDKP